MDDIKVSDKLIEIKPNDFIKVQDTHAKMVAIAFFKWNRNNFSSQPNEEELEERYNLFIKSTEQ